MIPLFKVRMSPTIMEELAPTLTSGFIAQGPRVDELEAALYGELDLPNEPAAVTSATSAIDLALELLNIGPGDEVISTPMTCFASNVGVLKRGATIIWADVEPTTGLIDPEDVMNKVTEKTKAIIAVDWAGQFANHRMLKEFGVPVIEDAAHVWDTLDHGRERGDFIVYSLQAIKFLTAADGGLLITPPEYHKAARDLRWYGLDRDNNENFRATQDIKRAGFKYNMNDVNASIALANIRYARNSVEVHRKNATILHHYLQNLGFADPVPWDRASSYWIFPLVFHRPGDRDHFERYMKARGVMSAQVHFRNDMYSVTAQFRKHLPGLDDFSANQTNIPCGWWLSTDDLKYIIEAVQEFGLPSGA